MALEDLTGTNKFVTALNAAWPVDDDWVDEGDNHIRGIKNVVKNTLPGWNGTQAFFPDGTEAVPGIAWTNDPSTGFSHNAISTMRYSVAGTTALEVTAKNFYVRRYVKSLPLGVAPFFGDDVAEFSSDTVGVQTLGIANSTAEPQGVDVVYTTFSGRIQGNTFIHCRDAVGSLMALWGNGGIGNFTANNVNFSDAGIKQEVTPVPDYSAFVGKLKFKRFSYAGMPATGEVDGVIAQEVQALDESLVTTIDGKLGVYEQRLQQRINSVIPRLIERIERLEARVAGLEAKCAGN